MILVVIALSLLLMFVGFVTGIYCVWVFLFYEDVSSDEFIADIIRAARERMNK